MAAGIGQQAFGIDVDDAFTRTLASALDDGFAVDGSRRSRELLAFSTGMLDARARVLACATRPLGIVGAVARFTWMVAGNNRLADIMFYEPRVAAYTDNGLTVPGSDYGMRIFEPRPGVNQLEGAVRRLEADRASRRAAAVIWCAEDAVRQSNDIPCAFGVFFHARADELVTTTTMRSNNALILLPYNFFEFSLLGEMVAAELGIGLGRYLHWVASMHVFDDDAERADAIARSTTPRSIRMAAMPMDPKPLSQALQLARLEPGLRMASTSAEVTAQLAGARDVLHPFWWSLLAVLGIYKLQKLGADVEEQAAAADASLAWLAEPLARLLNRSQAATPSATLFSPTADDPTNLPAEAASAQLRQRRIELSRLVADMDSGSVVVGEIEQMAGALATDERFALAARDGEELTVEYAGELLRAVRQRTG